MPSLEEKAPQGAFFMPIQMCGNCDAAYVRGCVAPAQGVQ